MDEATPATLALVAGLRESRKYATLSEDALRRTAEWALARSRNEKEAGKAARRKLHQVYGAYLPSSGMARAERAARALGEPDADLRDACRAVLETHASTRERLGFTDDFYEAAFGDLRGPVSVVDLACGLNPFSLPWMPVGEGGSYTGVDVDERFAALGRRLEAHVPLSVDTRTADLVSGDVEFEADVVLLLKAVHNLEQQDPGAARRLIGRVRARRLVISVPAHSLSGRKSGMREESMELLGQVVPEQLDSAERFPFPSETMVVLLNWTPPRTQPPRRSPRP